MKVFLSTSIFKFVMAVLNFLPKDEQETTILQYKLIEVLYGKK